MHGTPTKSRLSPHTRFRNLFDLSAWLNQRVSQLGSLLCWAERTEGEPLSDGWERAYRDDAQSFRKHQNVLPDSIELPDGCGTDPISLRVELNLTCRRMLSLITTMVQPNNRGPYTSWPSRADQARVDALKVVHDRFEDLVACLDVAEAIAHGEFHGRRDIGDESKEAKPDVPTAVKAKVPAKGKVEQVIPKSWEEVPDVKRAILQALSVQASRMTCRDLKSKAGYDDEYLKHHLSEMRKWGWIDNSSKKPRGYYLAQAGIAIIPKPAK